jgi:hypothetical protein
VRIRRSVRTILRSDLSLLLLVPRAVRPSAQSTMSALLAIAASKVENILSSTLFGQLAEFIIEDIKSALYAKLLRDRRFDEVPDALGLPRYWKRDLDDRNDNSLKFTCDASVYPPLRSYQNALPSHHSLQAAIAGDRGQRRGIRQESIPLRVGLEVAR